MNVKQARAVYVKALLADILSKRNIKDLADMCNDELEYQACTEAMYGPAPHRVTKPEAQDVISDMACTIIDDSDMIDSELEHVERIVRKAAEAALKKSVKIDGTRIVNVLVRPSRGQTRVIR